MYWIHIVLLLICIYFIYIYMSRFSEHNYNDATTENVALYENLNTDIIRLPNTSIVLESNDVSCHTTLTPCEGDGDCFQCQELLAKCQSFNEDVTIEINDTTITIPANESYCLAIDQKRSRSCNTHTGKWVLVKTDAGLGLICSCLYPGLVTQTNIYSDCDVSVGCNNAGVVKNMFSTPLECECNDGYVSDTINDQSICRPQQIRDVIYNTSLFPREPCPENYISVGHDALDESYKQQFILSSICIPDPCSIDPITGLTTYGQLTSTIIDDETVYFCNCTAFRGSFGIFTTDSMIKQSSYNVSNACISPFTQTFPQKDVYLKWFWGRNNPLQLSDMDFTFRLDMSYFKPKYWQMLQNISNGVGTLKFAIQETFYDTDNLDNGTLTYNHFTQILLEMEILDQPTCYQHNIRACTEDVCVWRTPRTFLVSSKEFFTGSKCHLSRLENDVNGLYPIIAYAPPSHYNTAFPVTLYILNNVTYASYNNMTTTDRRVYTINSELITTDYDTLSSLIYTYPNYSRTS
ncbi:per-os infectivity factor [Neodiprion sertifer nucleopolyhedrovirus]|uniref:Per-os infectivity factor n=1 Tax=Neodiprion sertifer nucleopolyhedrovirus TaxID=111874 RepID=Q6JK81_9CBAC|nr:per-os infectivity factor [Neodiprion sertifer nucleopolyhedrovirus]AAQ96456.1 per-os infectivity factor [Neodiprion sertifer nucleopolyhedrovirus]